MTKVVMHLAIDDATPADITSLLQGISQVEQPYLRFLVVCQSSVQAGQVRRRVSERLKNALVDGSAFGIDRSDVAPFFEVVLPSRAREADADDEAAAAEEALPPRTSLIQAKPEIRNSRSGDLPEGNYKVRLTAVRKEEQFGKFFANLNMEVLDGLHRGRRITDRVIVWPATPRTQHLARALGLHADHLGDRIDGCTGQEFWDRRRETIRKDGTLEIANYYYPLDAPPPPAWATR